MPPASNATLLRWGCRPICRISAGFAQEGLADADALMALMAQDKKVKRGKLTFILLEAVGRA